MKEKKLSFSNKKTFVFVVVLCASAALILSLVSEGLKTSQENAKKLYRSKQLLLAARLLGYGGYFLLDGKPALFDAKTKKLIATKENPPPKASSEAILALVEERILPRLTDDTGKIHTFEEVGLDFEVYLQTHEKLGYAHLPYKLIYIIMQDPPSPNPYGYILPVNGYGLWDAIYGYLGLKGNGDTVLGMTWYEQKETPGLGGEIALPEWQRQFFDKVIFQKDSQGKTNVQTAPLGIKVVKSTVKETYGNRPIAESSVDGIPGATITVTGVNDALRVSLAPYRSFLMRAYKGEVRIDE